MDGEHEYHQGRLLAAAEAAVKAINELSDAAARVGYLGQTERTREVIGAVTSHGRLLAMTVAELRQQHVRRLDRNKETT